MHPEGQTVRRFSSVFPDTGMLQPEQIRSWFELQKVDALDFCSLAPQLADIVAHMKPPGCFGIFGPWGTGKTQMMRCIKDILDDRLGGSIITTEFNTWQYDQSAGLDVCYGLLRCIEQSLYGDSCEKRMKRTKLKKALLTTLLAAGNTAVQLVTSGTVNPLKVVWGAKAAIDGTTSKLYDNWTDSVRDLSSLFGEIVEAGLAKKKAKRLVVFLDDLDRCLPHNVVATLEKLKNLFLTGNIIYVLGADREAIIEAICGHYHYSPAFGARYLDKVTALNFDLPERDGCGVFKLALDEATEAFATTEVPGILPAWRTTLLAAQKRLEEAGFGNPRVTRRVAIKLAILLSYLFWDAVYDEKREKARPDYLKVFELSDQSAKDSGRLSKAVIATAVAVAHLKAYSPPLFGKYNLRLLRAIDNYPRTEPVPGRVVSNEQRRDAHDTILRYGLHEETARRIGEALFRQVKGSALPPLTPDQLALIYRDMGVWL